MSPATRFEHGLTHVREGAQISARWFSGLSRHGVVAAERITQSPETRKSFRQIASLFAGSMFIGLGVSLFVHSGLGVPAYDVMLTALRNRLGISLGQAGWLFTGILLLIATVLGQRPRLSGIAYTIANGLAVDTALRLINDPEALGVRMLFVVLGTMSIATAVALVIHAGLTGGSLELLMRAGEDRGYDPYKVRRNLELGIVALGVLLGGDLGFATVFFVLTMSPILRIGRQALADHRLGREQRLDLATSV